jgi:adenylate cyclase, class 2
MPNEIEIKFRIEDLTSLSRALKSADFKLVTPFTHEINSLYDLPGQKLRKRGELLRLRKYGEAWVLTHKSKRKPGIHKVRLELETHVENGHQMEAILHALGFAATFRYEKHRAEWTDGIGHVVLDKTPIGNFGEIEGPSRWIDRTAKALGITREHYLTESYVELFLNWKHATGSKATDMTFRAAAKRLKTS